MPNTREKLIELLNEADEWADHKCDELECETCPADKMKSNCVQQLMVDRLIANGVTVQKWIPVTERLPEKKQDVLMYFDTGNMGAGFWHDGDEDITFWCAYTDDGWYTDCDCEPTHWMPLPEPPKGE